MNDRLRLVSLGNSSTASARSDPGGNGRSKLQLLRRDFIFFRFHITSFHFHTFLLAFFVCSVEGFSFFDCLSPFCVLLIEFYCTFSISYELLIKDVYYYYCILILFKQSGLLFPSVSAFLLSICLGKHSCMSSSFPIAILNGNYFFPTVQLQVHYVHSERKKQK